MSQPPLEAHERAVKKRGHSFAIGLGVYFLLMLGVTAGVMCYLWGYLQNYEANTPGAAVQRYVGLILAGNFDEIYDTSRFEASEFSGKAEYINYLQNVYIGDLSKLEYIKKAAKTKNEHVYDVRVDGKHVAMVELYPAEADSRYAWQARTRVHFLDSISIAAPPHVQVFVNGKKLDSGKIVADNTDVKIFSGAHEGVAVPKLVKYKVEGLLIPPKVTSQKSDGTPCAVVGDGADFTVSAVVSADKRQAQQALLEKVAKTYAAFITKNATATELHQYLHKDTDFFDAIKNFYNGWYIEHDSFEFRNMQVSELQEYSENDFTGSISFDYVIRKGSKEHIYPSHYELAFVNVDGKWLLVNLATK